MDSEENFEYVECNLCGSNSSDVFFKGKDIKYKKIGLFTVVKCKKCGLIYTNPRPKQDVISSYYPDEYWDVDNDLFDKEDLERKLKNWMRWTTKGLETILNIILTCYVSENYIKTSNKKL
jgi:hypothetical protein